MATFEFTVIASGLDPQSDDFEARFYEGKCDDATVSFQNGHTILDFEREARSIAIDLQPDHGELAVHETEPGVAGGGEAE